MGWSRYPWGVVSDCMDHLPGYHDTRHDVLARLRRIEGQIRGIERMVENDTYCVDVLTQVAAANKALQQVAVRLLSEHLRHCVAGAADPASGRDLDEMVAEAAGAIQRLMKV